MSPGSPEAFLADAESGHAPASLSGGEDAPDGAQVVRAGLSVLMIYVLLASLILIGTWALIAQDWLREQQSQETELLSLVHAADTHLAASLRETEDLLHLLARLRSPAFMPPVTMGADSAKRFQPVMAAELARSARVSAVFLRDAGGRVLTQAQQSGRMKPTPSPALPAPDLPPGAAGVLLHTPQQSLDGRWLLPLEQILHSPSGEIEGSLIALLDSRSLREHFQRVRLNAEDHLFLFDQHGLPLLTFGASATERPPLFAAPLPLEHDVTGVQSLRLEMDGEQHILALQKMDGRALYLAVSRPADLTRPGFPRMRQRLIVGAGSLIILLGVLSWLLHFDLRRRRQAHEAVARLNATLETRVRERTSELEQSNAELVAFSYSISHDLRAPLRAINGFAHALREDCSAELPAKGLDYVDRICRASVRMGELIDELLKLASISRHTLNIRPLNLGAMATDIMDELKLAEPQRPLEFTLRGSLQAEGDEVLMHNALLNLLGNAWKFTRTQALSRITLSSEDEADFTRITVSDNGIGFDMDHARRLFQPFQQLHAHQGFGGSGIGLASVRRIIERHGGQVWAESAPGEGARFILRLPRRARMIRRRPLH